MKITDICFDAYLGRNELRLLSKCASNARFADTAPRAVTRLGARQHSQHQAMADKANSSQAEAGEGGGYWEFDDEFEEFEGQGATFPSTFCRAVCQQLIECLCLSV